MGQVRSGLEPNKPEHFFPVVRPVGNLTDVDIQAVAQLLTSAGIDVTGSGQLNTVTTTTAGVNKGASVNVVQTSVLTEISLATGVT